MQGRQRGEGRDGLEVTGPWKNCRWERRIRDKINFNRRGEKDGKEGRKEDRANVGGQEERF